jgi:hypothetical protein
MTDKLRKGAGFVLAKVRQIALWAYDKFHMTEWLVLAIGLMVGLHYIAPQQLPLFVYKESLVILNAFLGYWLDRRLFGKVTADAWTQMRRAIVVSAIVIAGAIAL